ncbi:MAG: GYD domain-containing protein [Desulfuromonadales bacterium]
MAHYLMLFQFTQQGVGKIKESPQRVEAAKDLARQLGGEVKAFYALMGEYDTVFIVHAPSDEVVTRIAMAISSHGYVRTTTMRAFSEEEFRELVREIP